MTQIEEEDYSNMESDPLKLLKPLFDAPIKRLMCCNRGEIAIRVFRCCKENNIASIAVYSEQDKLALHRNKADEAYQISAPNGSPVGAYLAINEIIKIAKQNQVDAIHPGYGFLSENQEFARKCQENDIIFVGPNYETIQKMGDKTAARNIAKQVGVPIIPGTEFPLKDKQEALEWCKQNGLPVMMKAAMGGGGRGMRVVRKTEDIEDSFDRCQSEALTAFGDGSVFLEKLIEKPRHIEVQILADSYGDTIHLFDRDCSVQRRHQKVVEIAPASHLNEKIRQSILDSAVQLAKSINYKNAGTVEFLVENDGSKFYFIEVNPRIQVEHTVTEEVTGIDIVQAQIMIAGGASLKDLGLKQEDIKTYGFAIQSRLTTEDPKQGFMPDTGRVNVFRSPMGMGIRLDSCGYQGMIISPYYDSLLTKVIARGKTFKQAAQKLYRALDEFTIRGVKTNKYFVKNVLSHPQFFNSYVDTSFIDSNPSLLNFDEGQEQKIERLLEYLGELAVNGNTQLTAKEKPIKYPEGVKPKNPIPPEINIDIPPQDGWRKILKEQGIKAFTQAVRNHDKPLFMDTTWRDAHQSLLATRVRTKDIAKIAPATARCFYNAFALEMWGGATFDVALRFLNECPWQRLRILRKLVPNIPFQMLLRGANAVGYKSYPDNVVEEFCKHAVLEGIDIFRVFDSLNYIENLKFGIDAVRKAGGVVEATICYTGDVQTDKKYNLNYYMKLTQQLVEHGIDILGIKDMAGLLKPDAATVLIGAIRAQYPDLVIHIHTHDTAGTGAFSMFKCIEAGADIVDGAIDCMANSNSQPSIGTFDSLFGEKAGIILDKDLYSLINDYWIQTRLLYQPFEMPNLSSALDVYRSEMPGGQITNLKFQAESMGIGHKWDEVRKAYASANKVLGGIIKVTPSSKVVGDFALFLVQNNLDEESVVEKAQEYDFPDSVLDLMNGKLGIPEGGFPEPFRSRVLKGKSPLIKEGERPGQQMKPFDYEVEGQNLSLRTAVPLYPEKQKKFDTNFLDFDDIISYSMYPEVYTQFLQHRGRYGDTSHLPTQFFFSGMEVGEEFSFINQGKENTIKLSAKGQRSKDGTVRVFYELNGTQYSLDIVERSSDQSQQNLNKKEKADQNIMGQIGAPMKGMIVDIVRRQGQNVEKGDPIAILSAMKMETIISATCSGVVSRVAVKIGESINQGDLVVCIEPKEDKK